MSSLDGLGVSCDDAVEVAVMTAVMMKMMVVAAPANPIHEHARAQT